MSALPNRTLADWDADHSAAQIELIGMVRLTIREERISPSERRLRARYQALPTVAASDFAERAEDRPHV